MIRVGTAQSLQDLKTLSSSGANEVLLGMDLLSRYGTIKKESLVELAQEAKNLGLRPILEWDILMIQPEFEKARQVIDSIPHEIFDAIRVQDPGAYEYVLENRSEPIQLVLETGNHNFESVVKWCDYGQPRLERVALSSQLPVDILERWVSKLAVQVEILGLGPILILYTPRHLLSNQLPEEEAKGVLRATASSEESLHSGFRVVENQHGTFVFLGKDYCLMDQIDSLYDLGLGALRIDLRIVEGEDALGKMKDLFSAQTNIEATEILKNYPHETTRCFFKANNTDKAFVKLKNKNLLRDDHGFIGEVVESDKDSYLVIHVKGRSQSLKKGKKIFLINTEGLQQEITIQSLRNVDSVEVDEIRCGDLGVIPFVRRVTSKSSVYMA